MKAGQVITLLCALVLLLPGTCFAVAGVVGVMYPGGLGLGFVSLLISAAFLAAVIWLIRVVIRWNRIPGAAPSAGSDGGREPP